MNLLMAQLGFDDSHSDGVDETNDTRHDHGFCRGAEEALPISMGAMGVGAREECFAASLSALPVSADEVKASQLRQGLTQAFVILLARKNETGVLGCCEESC